MAFIDDLKKSFVPPTPVTPKTPMQQALDKLVEEMKQNLFRTGSNGGAKPYAGGYRVTSFAQLKLRARLDSISSIYPEIKYDHDPDHYGEDPLIDHPIITFKRRQDLDAFLNAAGNAFAAEGIRMDVKIYPGGAYYRKEIILTVWVMI